MSVGAVLLGIFRTNEVLRSALFAVRDSSQMQLVPHHAQFVLPELDLSSNLVPPFVCSVSRALSRLKNPAVAMFVV